MNTSDIIFGIANCQRCKKEFFVVSDNVVICDSCRNYNQPKEELLD